MTEMRNIINSWITFLAAIVGLIGGIVWAYISNLDFEPIILAIISLIEIIGFLITSNLKTDEQTDISKTKNINKNSQNVKIIVNNTAVDKKEETSATPNNRNAIIESKKDKVNILFIDDDKKFNVVKILKDSGWKNTKTVVDVKSIDVPIVQKADILFVDINGVGKLLQLEYEGLDLALMIKQKYGEKKVIIYSANKNTNAFHKAWDIIDKRLVKNALPYQFQNLVENFSLEFYN